MILLLFSRVKKLLHENAQPLTQTRHHGDKEVGTEGV